MQARYVGGSRHVTKGHGFTTSRYGVTSIPGDDVTFGREGCCRELGVRIRGGLLLSTSAGTEGQRR